MFLRTERLSVRRFTAADAERFAAYRSDPDVARFQGWTAPVPLDEARENVERFAAGDPEAPGWFQYAVALDDVLIGDLGLKLHENLMQADLGFTFATEYQGKGYASEAV
ncbi:MAG TPA: GNAT family N-acetyltransferase, partial [Kribbella sp.]|nr:GNAT family N-acetyltransferase [Kribbella sp.]